MSATSRYEDEIVISWPELHRDARYLSQELHDRGTWQGIVAITRGGLVPAALVARELEIRLIDTVCISSYAAGTAGGAEQQQSGIKVLKTATGDGDGYLLIDDLVDTGRTAQVVRQLLPKAFFATLYAKPAGRPYVDTCVKEFKQNKWIYFPWDIDYRFAKPIRDGGRIGGGAIDGE
ncbi:MAG: xanthine phosphoribosyltransferase [Opitutus sp.]